ncbi:carboxylesterase family protein [Paraburkholderia nemoris]|uniref:Carboxylic ester hydrolase n=1 Tax=Paraburkholderia nemoris TaxID=2793076 RepID=A0ABN7N6Y4_9BURK|nr:MULTISPECIES: carboxylesterase family protein [Paraburkholderia]MBK5152252.1 carboxylesterase family protein [Burkholderia sp. R-69608]MBK3815584.1 carboxylesterase family protein [Paraburkholderia aspalathi]CAE6844243.1 Carboxylesterase [Paraburkholderia nemoris]CAE6845905.1 Carboxylesterase [Paraburkholderia nemoris]CAE6963791.1 Carboxylesterase [Paraburkholderia nemoris]
MEHFSSQAAAVVQTHSGKVRGHVNEGVGIWLGVPYGAATGELGPFAEVGPAPAWDGTLDCGGLPAVFTQPQSRLAAVMGPAIDAYPQSDQAFTVNVFAPPNAQGLPVLVFVHGGGFSSGGGTRWYDGSTLARDGNIVVVTVNYRLGIWGSLYAQNAPSNNTVRDVLAALRWVAANINAFGGDAANVTLSGQSAGALLTRLLTLCAEAKGLFKRAIMLSCPGRLGAASDDIGDATRHVMRILGVSDVAALAREPAARVLEAVTTATRERTVPGSVAPLFRPYADGVLLHDWMDDLDTAAGRAHCSEIMVGFTREEFTSFLWQQAESINHAPDSVLAWYRNTHGADATLRYRQAALHRTGATPYTQWVDAMSDDIFGLPAMAMASSYARHGHAFAYRFDLQTRQPNLYAPHCLELPFFFGNLADWFDAPMLEGFSRDELQPLASRFSASVTNFVRTGKPGLGKWHAFSDTTPFLMSFDKDAV